MFKLLKKGYEFLPDTYNHFASKIRLSSKRKEEIEERRGRLKIEDEDPQELHIVIEEMLAYKPGVVTLDDRYYQLEKILDAIDETRVSKKTEDLISLCQEITKEISDSPGMFKNSFLERLRSINARLNPKQRETKEQNKQIKAKL